MEEAGKEYEPVVRDGWSAAPAEHPGYQPIPHDLLRIGALPASLLFDNDTPRFVVDEDVV
jgi:hypothetical protein